MVGLRCVAEPISSRLGILSLVVVVVVLFGETISVRLWGKVERAKRQSFPGTTRGLYSRQQIEVAFLAELSPPPKPA